MSEDYPMLTNMQKEKIRQMKLTEANHQDTNVLVNLLTAKLMDVPAIACLDKKYWDERDRMLYALRRFQPVVLQSMKDVERQIGKTFGQGEMEQGVLVVVPKANGTR